MTVHVNVLKAANSSFVVGRVREGKCTDFNCQLSDISDVDFFQNSLLSSS